MVNVNNNYRSSVLLAIALHLILFAALFIHFSFKPNRLVTQPAVNIINATVINTSSQQVSPQPKPVVQPKQEVVQKKEIVKEKKLESMQEQKTVVQKDLVAEQVKQELLVQEKQEKAAQKQAAKKAAEQAAKQMMQQELAAETKTEEKSESATAESAAAAQNQGEIDKYKTLIIQAISQKWIVPENLSKGLEAKLLVTLAPGGMVVNVKIVKSSGDEVLDRSAETAVYKASPLPVPNDSTLFNQFRTINLIVHPEGIIAGGE